MMKTITKPIVHRRSMRYMTGVFLLLLSIAFPYQTFSQTCLQNAQIACETQTPIITQLDENDVFRVRVFRDFYANNPVDCNRNDFMAVVRDVDADTLLVDANSADPNFRYNNACAYVGKKLKAQLFYQDGGNMIPVCERQVILLPQIQCADTILYCNHPVFDSTMDENIFPIQFGCEDFDPSGLDIEITHEYWDDMVAMDTLFRIWEVRANNGKGVVTCTDTIVREAIPLAEIIFPADDTIFCENWNGSTPLPDSSGRPYLLTNDDTDTIFLDAGEVQHCINVSYTDEPWGEFQCEKEKYMRYWKVRTADGVRKDTQMITILDTLGPVGEFRFQPVDSVETVIAGGETIKVPVYRISTGAHGCESDGSLPILYTTDDCSGVAKVSVSVVVDGIPRALTNGGPFMGFEEGKYIVKYTAADSCWNESTYYVGVEVVDHVNPVISLGTQYTITMSGQVTWLNLQEFATHHITDNCDLELIVGRRMGDHSTSCGADDSTSVVGMYRQKYAQWLEYDGWNCTELVNVDDGWMDKIPFCCADVGSEIMIEIMAIDASCNVTRAMTTMIPVDKGVATIQERLPDVTLACEAWNEHYSHLIQGDTLPNNLNIDSLDKYFGTYLPYEPGQTVESQPISIEDLSCYTEGGTMFTEESLFNIYNGYYTASCAGEFTQEASLVYDEGCNTFTIVRRFLINGNEIAQQKISTEIRCPFVPELFDYPASRDTMITIANINILNDPTYWIGNRFNLTTEGPVYNGSDCRVIAMGYVDKLMDMVSSSNPNEADAVIMRTWCMADWCSSDLGPDWKSSIGNDGIITWVQNIKIFVDPDNPDVSIAKADPNAPEDIVVVPPGSKEVFQVRGRIRTEDALNVNNVTVAVKTTEHSEEMLTNESGSFEIEVDKGSRLNITPVKKGGLENGLSTLDLIMIQRHLLQKQLITSPYKLIAADANNDKKLSLADVLFLRRVILAKTEGLSEADSWKFIDADYTFINEKAAYSENYPTAMDVQHLDKDLETNFIAVKLGDVNHSVNVSRSSSRSNKPFIAFQIQDRKVQRGEILEIPVKLAEEMNVTGMQFALRFDPASLDVLEVNSDHLDLTDHEMSLDNGLLRLSWTDLDGPRLGKGEPVMTIKVQVLQEVDLSNVMALNPSDIEPEIYDSQDKIYGIGLKFGLQQNEYFTVHQNRPNPVTGETTIDYELDRATKVYLQIHDVTGKRVYTAEADALQGHNQFQIHTGQLTAGVLYYTISDGQRSATRKMVVIQ